MGFSAVSLRKHWSAPVPAIALASLLVGFATPAPAVLPARPTPAIHATAVHATAVHPTTSGTQFQCPPSWLGTTLTANPTVSADGRFVAFTGQSPDGDEGGTSVVLLRDTRLGVTFSVAQVTPAGRPYAPIISDDGTRVAYLRNSPLGGRRDDLYVYDRRSGRTTHEGQADVESALDFSADGRYLTYWTAGTDEWDWSITPDVYVRDLDSDRTTLVSVSADGGRGNGASINPTISADGRYVLFSSQATNLPSGQDSLGYAIYLRDLVRHRTTVLRHAEDGSILYQSEAQLSPDGRYVLYTGERIYRYDRTTGRTLTLGPVPAEDRFVGAARLSDHGRFVAYQTTFLVGGDLGDAFTELNVINVKTGTEEQANVGLDHNQPWTGAYFGALSPNGRYLTFYSDATNLVPDDTNNAFDVFVRDLKSNRTLRASEADPGPVGCTP